MIKSGKRAMEIYREGGLRQLIRSIHSSIKWRLRGAQWALHTLTYEYYHRYEFSEAMDESWDNLIILDGCRYDMFEELNTIAGTLQKRHSKGSSTSEFLRRNFTNQYDDTVYVTANPQYRVNEIEGSFYAIIDVWDHGWDDDLKTVPPEVVTDAAIEAHETYPNKRLLVHYMQPHYPFIGPEGERLGETRGFETVFEEMEGRTAKRYDAWTKLEAGEVETEEVKRAYWENLEIVLPTVETLLDRIDGKSVVTSDHGNLLGEYVFPFVTKQYGHPSGLRAKNLIEVPWLVIDSNSHRSIQAEAAENEDASYDHEAAKERLEHLGYVDT